MKPLITENADAEKLSIQLGIFVCEKLTEAIKHKNQASLVVSGGSTPKFLFQYLSNQDIPWDKVTITLADERCVAVNNSANNGKMIQGTLLQGFASRAKFLSLYDEPVSDSVAIKNAISKISAIDLPYDVVILGMGDDGHTASIFPQAINIKEALDINNEAICMLVDPVTTTPLRITQTRKQLLTTNNLILHFFSDTKRIMFNKLLNENASTQFPISYFIHQDQTELSVFCNTARSDC
jgi:6-phosphogluconolactonase